MKNIRQYLILFSSILLIEFLWVVPILGPMSDYTNPCLRPSNLKFDDDTQTLISLELNFKECKSALSQNESYFDDISWRTKPWCKLYSPQNLALMVFTPFKFLHVRESNAILDKLTMDALVISSLRAKLYKNGPYAKEPLNEISDITAQYIAYYQLNRSGKMIERHKAFIDKKFLGN